MSKHTFICAAGRRLEITESKTTPGAVQITILSADRSHLAQITTDAPTAGVMAMAFDVVAKQVSLTAGVREFNAVKRAVLPPAAVQAYADNNGRKPAGA